MKIIGAILLSLVFTLSFACSDDCDLVPDSGGGKDMAPAAEAGGDLYISDQREPDQAAPDQALPDQMLPDAPPASACPTGGKSVALSGKGTCTSPYLVDLTGLKVGDVAYLSVPGTAGADEKQFYYTTTSGCTGPKSTARDIIFALTLPSSGVSGVWVSADAAAGADPIATMLEDQSCGQPANACANNNGAGKEECLLAKKGGTGYFGNKPYAVVSEVAHSGSALTVRFKMVP